jgi:site-specific DNA-methyltransferase (adenine-specific)
VWSVPLGKFPGAHFAVFPEGLVEPCIKAGCPPGGLVLDPFMGAGTTALVARRLGRSFLGLELVPEYVALAERRLAAA